jgi:hypothetical protein
MSIKPLDTLLAFKALGLVPNLNANDRRVATVLIEHYNRRTGQCDPGLRRIADLLGISTRTVIRSNCKLEAAGLFKKVRHGGHLNRNSYEPNWSRFYELEAAWQTKFRVGAKSQATKPSVAPSQSCHIPGDGTDTQTFSTNLSQETCPKRLPSGKRSEPLAVRQPTVPSLAGTKSVDAASAEAERRWSNDLHQEFCSTPSSYGDVIDAIDPSMQLAATKAELSRRGGGLSYILRQLKLIGSQ